MNRDAAADSTIHGAKVEYANVFATDVAPVVDFLSRHFGFTVLHAADDYTALSAGSISLGVAKVDTADPHQASLVGVHTGVGIMVDDLDAAHAALADAGVEFSLPPTRYPWGGYMALVTDPAGNVYYLDQRGTH